MDLNVLIVGGGVHGVGLLHDLATRRVGGVHLVEQTKIASGSSSRTTKLLHGGLRYLEHLSQWGLVHEALHERTLLLSLLQSQNLVRALPLVLPNLKKSRRSSSLIRAGLWLYDILSGDGGLPITQSIDKKELLRKAPYFNAEKVEQNIESAFLYFDAQMLDDVIARIVAEAAVMLGASYAENATVNKVTPIEGGFRVLINHPDREETLTTRSVVNAAGAWCNANLLRWQYIPNLSCFLNLGTHIVFKPEAVPQGDVHTNAAAVLQEPDGRIVFFIPWFGKWLYGTTESVFHGEPSLVTPPQSDRDYLMQTAEEMFCLNDPVANTAEVFSGVRCMPLTVSQPSSPKEFDPAWASRPYDSPFYLRHVDKNISGLSRETVIDEIVPGLFSIYGGKYTTYRKVAEKLGGRLARNLKMGTLSGTHLLENWFLEDLRARKPEIFASSSEIRH